MTRRRQPPSYSSLTSLLDVLFILLFATLVQSATLVEKAEEDDDAEALASDAGVGDAMASDAMRADAGPDASREPLDHGELYERAVGEITAEVRARAPIFVRVDPSGLVTAIERGPDDQIELDVPLIERVPDPDIGLAYLGDRDPALRICAIVEQAVADVDLSNALVVIVPGAPLARLPVALVEGLRRDQDRCMVDGGVFAVVVDPTRYPPEVVP